MDAAQYLRKSRMEEGLNTEEVLAKHRQALAEYAARNDTHCIDSVMKYAILGTKELIVWQT